MVSAAFQMDMFAEPLLPGLDYARDFLTQVEETELIARIDAEPLSPFRYQQWTGKRLTHSFGWSYDFETGHFGPADPLPAWLLPTRDRAARFAGLAPEALVQALLIRYDAGAGIGWHKDRPVFEDVIGISLGSSAPMRLRRRKAATFDRRTVTLEPRSIYRMAGEARNQWEHSIAEMEARRWSITFRSMRPAQWP